MTNLIKTERGEFIIWFYNTDHLQVVQFQLTVEENVSTVNRKVKKMCRSSETIWSIPCLLSFYIRATWALSSLISSQYRNQLGRSWSTKKKMDLVRSLHNLGTNLVELGQNLVKSTKKKTVHNMGRKELQQRREENRPCQSRCRSWTLSPADVDKETEALLTETKNVRAGWISKCRTSLTDSRAKICSSHPPRAPPPQKLLWSRRPHRPGFWNRSSRVWIHFSTW